MNSEHSCETGPEDRRVFGNVCEQLDRPPRSTTLEQHRERFVAGLGEGARAHIDDLEARGLTNRQIYRELWQRMAAYIARYQNDPRFEKKKVHVSTFYRRFTGHIDTLLERGEVDPRTARVFLGALPSLPSIGDYYAIIRDDTDISPEALIA